MITEAQVKAKLKELLDYSQAQNAGFASDYAALMAPLEAAVSTYFSTPNADMPQALKDCVFYVFCDMFRRGFEREHKFGRPYPTNFPETYSDIRKCFYSFPIMNVTPQAFYAAWVIGVPEDPEGGGDGGTTPQPKPISNPYIDSELAGLATAPQDDLDAVNALSSWCQDAAADSDLVSLLEDEGKILKSPDRQQIATDIYESKGMKDIIQTRGFDVYIPSYV